MSATQTPERRFLVSRFWFLVLAEHLFAKQARYETPKNVLEDATEGREGVFTEGSKGSKGGGVWGCTEFGVKLRVWPGRRLLSLAP